MANCTQLEETNEIHSKMGQLESRSVISLAEVAKYHELGLGRGVNVTDPQMWKNKSSFLVREVRYDNTEAGTKNIIGTEECGMKEKYTKEVSTFAMNQQKIRLSLGDPSSQVKVGMDAHHSQSSSTTKVISGTKIETRTVAFRFDINDVPLYSSVDKATVDVPTDNIVECFEEHLSTWILKRITDRKDKGVGNQNDQGEVQPDDHQSLPEDSVDGDQNDQGEVQPDDHQSLPEDSVDGDQSDQGEGESSVTQLCDELSKMSSDGINAIKCDCVDFISNIGITHYVSAIKLGAMRYRVLSTSTEQSKLGAGAELGAAHVAKGGVSGLLTNQWFHKTENEQEIGRMSECKDKHMTVTSEAVIGFQIQPLHKLVRVQYIQMAIQKAIKEYIQHKADNSEGPFLISCKVGKKPIYWTVNEQHHHQVVGTELVKEASLFYIIPTGDTFHPSEFFVTYWGKEKNDRKLVMNVKDPYRKQQKEEPPLPHYLTTNSNLFGYSSGPLELKQTVIIQEARFSLHSRVQPSFACMMCRSTPVSLSSWIEGEEFYISCSQRSFKVDGYIAMRPECRRTCTYKTTTVPMMKDPSNSKDLGMLFRLQPPELKTGKSTVTRGSQTTEKHGD